MAEKTAVPDINSWLEDELRQQYRHDRRAVDESWKDVFESSGGNGAPAPAPPAPPAISKQIATTAVTVAASEQLAPLRGAAARIAENMPASLQVPTATSQRMIPVKVMEENRRIINQHRTLVGRSKISYHAHHRLGDREGARTHPRSTTRTPSTTVSCFAWCAVRGLGIAVDVVTGGNNRSLVVPNIKDAGKLDFAQYLAAFDDLVARARRDKLTAGGFSGHDDFADQSRHGRDGRRRFRG